MKKYDYRHIAFHVLVALYFIWLPVFCILLAISLSNIYADTNAGIEKLLMTWIFLNMLMGTGMFVVLQLFRHKGLLNNVIRITYLCMAVATLTTVLVIINKK